MVRVDREPMPEGVDNLRALGAGAGVRFVIDDEAVCAELKDQGLEADVWRADLPVVDGDVVVLLLCHQPVSRAVRQQFGPASVLLLPIVSFDADPEAVMYTVRLLLATDFADTCRRNGEWIDLLRSTPAAMLSFSGPNVDLNCRLHDELRAHTSLDVAIAKGEWVSVADYCEVSLTAPSQKNWCGAFTIDGVAQAAGVLVAEDSRVTPEGSARIQAAKQLRRELVDSGPVGLVMEQGVLRSVTVGGRDRTAEVLDVTNGDYGLHAVELGLGSNLGVAPLIDWGFNSQMNEGAAKVHLGFGEGITGAHMDFVLDGAALVT